MCEICVRNCLNRAIFIYFFSFYMVLSSYIVVLYTEFHVSIIMFPCLRTDDNGMSKTISSVSWCHEIWRSVEIFDNHQFTPHFVYWVSNIWKFRFLLSNYVKRIIIMSFPNEMIQILICIQESTEWLGYGLNCFRVEGRGRNESVKNNCQKEGDPNN